MDGTRSVESRSGVAPLTIKGTEDQLSLELADAVWWDEEDDHLVIVPRSSLLALKRRIPERQEEQGLHRRDDLAACTPRRSDREANSSRYPPSAR
jgi:hypothetical protein